MSTGYSVTITTDGRSGHVQYSEGILHSHQFYWEFGGGDVVASIDVPRAHEWDRKIPWAAGRRDEVLQRLAEEVCRQQCPTCQPSFDDGWVNLVQG